MPLPVQAKQNAPCIIFVDEIDAVGRSRGTGVGGGNDEREQVISPHPAASHLSILEAVPSFLIAGPPQTAHGGLCHDVAGLRAKTWHDVPC